MYEGKEKEESSLDSRGGICFVCKGEDTGYGASIVSVFEVWAV